MIFKIISYYFKTNMGYGPSDCNRFGWCWRNEHGGGKRMTPYFKTEELVDKFHDYFTENINRYSSKSVISKNPMLAMFCNGAADLRLFKLTDVNEITNDFIKENKLIAKNVIITPKKETLREFYGFEMEEYCAYYEEHEQHEEPVKTPQKKKIRPRT